MSKFKKSALVVVCLLAIGVGFLAIRGVGGEAVPQSYDWTAGQAELAAAYDSGDLRSFENKYRAILDRDPNNVHALCVVATCIPQGDVATQNLRFPMNRGCYPFMTSFHLEEIAARLRKHVDRGNALPAEILAYARIVKRVREPEMAPLQVVRTSTTTATYNGRTEHASMQEMGPDAEGSRRVNELVSHALMLEPESALALLQKARECTDPNERFDAFYRAWKAERGWPLRAECQMEMAKSVKTVWSARQWARFSETASSKLGRSRFLEAEAAVGYSMAVTSHRSMDAGKAFQ